MLAALHPRPRMTYWRRTARRGLGPGPSGYGQAIALHKPRCLGELRLADLLRAGAISRDEFDANGGRSSASTACLRRDPRSIDARNVTNAERISTLIRALECRPLRSDSPLVASISQS